jgi:hypothetical protein
MGELYGKRESLWEELTPWYYLHLFAFSHFSQIKGKICKKEKEAVYHGRQPCVPHGLLS